MASYGHRFIVLVVISVLLLLGTLPVTAQTGDADGDGLPDGVDQCPSEAGPRENRGCPWPDTDGDGLIDREDRCPDRAGPRENGGCPIDPTPEPPAPPAVENNPPNESPLIPTQVVTPAPELPPLPDLPVSESCLVATASMEPVNIRQLPAADSSIAGTLDPFQIYTGLLQVQTEAGTWWLLKEGGFVAGWVTRRGGNCSVLFGLLLPAVQNIRWTGRVPPDGLPFLAQFAHPGLPTGTWVLDSIEDGQLVLSPGDLVGFDPQPDPPGETSGFDPQPDPPALMLFVPPGAAPDRLMWGFGDGAEAACDGSVVPGDGSVMPQGMSILFCDGSVMPSWLLPASDDGESLNPSWLLPASDGGESSNPSWLLPATVFPNGGGEALGCVAYTGTTASCLFSDGTAVALCEVSEQSASCFYS